MEKKPRMMASSVSAEMADPSERTNNGPIKLRARLKVRVRVR